MTITVNDLTCLIVLIVALITLLGGEIVSLECRVDDLEKRDKSACSKGKGGKP